MRGRTYTLVVASVLAAVMLFGVSIPAMAALDEKDLMDDINNTIAVLHGLHKELFYIERNRQYVTAATGLTQSQHDAMQQLYDKEIELGRTERAEIYKYRLNVLNKQMDKLTAFDFQTEYDKRIGVIQGQLKKIHVQLDIRTVEFEVLFGRKPFLDFSFMRDLEKRKGTLEDPALYLKLPR